MNSSVTARPAAVAGRFYPGDPAALRALVRAQLALAPDPVGDPPKALVAPHAGYAYSGPIAARAYARVAPLRGRVSRVVLLGPVHRVPVRGLALPGVDRFETPLGSVPVDRAAVHALKALPQIIESPRAHAAEHSLEVHLPFLQEVLGEFSLVPLAVGDATSDEVAAVLERVWGGDETLVVVSSDLSHYLPYAEARARDEDTAARIVALDAHLGHDDACGATPVNGLLTVAKRHGLRAELVDLRSSGDTEGDREHVVGYAAVAFTPVAPFDKPTRETTREELGRALLSQARAAIATRLGLPATPPTERPDLAAPGATFVTLTHRGDLRGCVGSIAAWRPLREDVRDNAINAAVGDPRFSPVSPGEYPELGVEVSLLSASTPIAFTDETDLLRQLRPGVDGVTLRLGDRRATFLPQVWDDVGSAREFIRHLKRKMGMPMDAWPEGIAASRYTVEKFTEAP